jgi:hypothetical protein
MRMKFWQITIIGALLTVGLLNVGGFLISPVREGECRKQEGVCVDKCAAPQVSNFTCTKCVSKERLRKEYCAYLREEGGRCKEGK